MRRFHSEKRRPCGSWWKLRRPPASDRKWCELNVVLALVAAADTPVATALAEGMRTLKQDGIEKVLQGITDMHQVRAVCIK